MVWHTFPLLDRNLVGDYGQAAVELHRIAVDDFAMEALGQVHCELSIFVSSRIFLFEKRKLQTLDFPVPVAPTTVMRGSMMAVDRGRERRNTLRKQLNMPENGFSTASIPWFVVLFLKMLIKRSNGLHLRSRPERALAVVTK
jgi:hypothetical protein